MNRAELVQEIKTLEKLLASYKTILEIYDSEKASVLPKPKPKVKRERGKSFVTTEAMLKLLKENDRWLTTAQIARRLQPGANAERNTRLKNCVRSWLHQNTKYVEKTCVDQKIMFRGV